MERGRQLPNVGVLTYYFAEKCMKMKELGLQGARVPGALLRSATDYQYKNSNNLLLWTSKFDAI